MPGTPGRSGQQRDVSRVDTTVAAKCAPSIDWAMPIFLDISHPDRMVVAVVHGTVTGEDIADAVGQFVATGAWQYRKIIDVSIGRSTIDQKALEALAALARTRSKDATRGPTAFVIDPARGEIVDQFIKMTEGERPVKTFRSIHDARKWLDDNTQP